MEISNNVKAILSDQLGLKEKDIHVLDDIRLDLGADSLDCIEISIALEESFSIEIPNEDMEGLTAVKDLIEYVEKKVKV